MEALPAQHQAGRPDHHGAQAVQHHPGGGAYLLGDTDACKVEKGDADGVAQQRQDDEGLVADLTERVQSVLQNVTRVVAEAAHGDEKHRDEKQREDDEPKEACRERK